MSEENNPEKKKKGIWSGLSNIFFEQETESTESSSEESVSSTPVESTSIAEPAAPVTFVASTASTGDGVFDSTFNEAFEKVIADNDIQGIDYLEFSKALKQMSGTGLAEPIAFQTVFTTLKVSDPNLSKGKLTSAVDHYISVLRNEENEFNSEMNDNIQREVTARRNEAESLNNENQDLVKKIQEIQEKISQNQQKAIQLNSEASSFEAKINQTHKNFVTTLTNVISNLENDKNKIEQLIKE
jgi:hypothetical protein